MHFPKTIHLLDTHSMLRFIIPTTIPIAIPATVATTLWGSTGAQQQDQIKLSGASQRSPAPPPLPELGFGVAETLIINVPTGEGVPAPGVPSITVKGNNGISAMA